MPTCRSRSSCSPKRPSPGLLLLAALLLAGCKHADEPEVAAKVPVRAEAVRRGDLAEVVEASGTLEAPPGFDVKLAPIAAGRLAEVLVSEGDRVRAGQVLARLDASPLRDALVQAEAQVAQGRAQAANAGLKLSRAEQAFRAGVAAGQEVDDARLAAESAQAQVRSAQAQASTAKNQLARGELRAPFDGVVARRLAAAGEPVDPGRPVIEVARIDVLELRAPVAARLAVRLRAGQAAQALVDASPGESWPASVIAGAPVIDAASGAALVRVRVPNPGLRLKAGSLARARVTLQVHRAVLLVPQQALLEGPEGTMVSVVEQEKAKRVPVKAGVQEGGQVEILEGLAEGQLVIVQGAYALPDGTPVALEAAAPVAGPAK